MTTVVVAAASPVARAGLQALLARDPALRVVAAVAPGDARTVALDTGAPDVLLLEAADDPLAALAADPPAGVGAPDPEHGPAIVLLAEAASPRAAAEVLRAGARGILPWDASPDEIVAAVHAAAAGLVVLPAQLAAEALPASTRLDARSTPGGDAAPLTPRERQVLDMMAEGLGNKSIARRLGISEHTVKTHVAALFAKLGASSRTEAVAMGVRRGLVVL